MNGLTAPSFLASRLSLDALLFTFHDALLFSASTYSILYSYSQQQKISVFQRL